MLGKNIRLLRKSRGLSQEELAKKIGVSTSAIGMYEQGRREPDNAKLQKICEFFDVTMDYLTGLSPTSSRHSEASDIFELLDRMESDVRLGGGLMFNGEPIGDEELGRVFEAMRLGVMLRLKQDMPKND